MERSLEFRRPRIGITGPDGGGWPAWITTALAVYRAGGWPVRIRPSKPCAAERLEGLILGGGADVDPKLYHEERVMPEIRRQMRNEVRRKWEKTQSRVSLLRHRVASFGDFTFVVSLWLLRKLLSLPWARASEWIGRDELEVPLAREALERGLPVLGICRGMQLINVCLGGSLYQEIADFYEERPQLTTLLPRKKIEIEPGSRLHELFGRTMTRVNSLHFQSVKELGRGLHVSAMEPTGVIQAIEHRDACFVLGVQWHPEYLAHEPRQQRLFRALVEAAVANRAGRRKRIMPASFDEAMGEIESAHPHAPPPPSALTASSVASVSK